MDPSRNIFWGLVVKPGKRYETEVQEPFRITKACLEPATAGGKVSSVFVECDNNEEFIIANLNAKNFNETVDLSFNEGEKICFKVDGPGTVHMTGNLLDDPPPDGMLGGDDWSEEESEESEEEAVEAPGGKIREVSEKEAEKILKRKNENEESKGDKKAKKAKVEEIDTTVDTSLGDLDDTENFAEENDSESDDDDEDDSDAESSDEENTTVGDTTAEMADTTAASDDEGDESESSEEDSDEDEKEPTKPVETPSKKKVIPNGDVKTPTDKKKGGVDASKINLKEKEIKASKVVEVEKNLSTPKSESKNSKKESKTPKQEVKTLKDDSKTPKTELKTPKQESKTPKQESKTPKLESKTPKVETKTPKQEPKTPKDDSKTPKQDPKTPKDSQTPGKTPKRTLKGGVQVEDIKEGSGQECKAGHMVGMYYEGRLKSNNKRFDGLQSGKPFKFKLGSGQVIKGWDVGVLGMKVGGKRKLIIPAQLGYGAQGAPPDIPPNSTLVFDIECKFVK